MPVQALHDLVTSPPRPLDEPFALVARRITAAWLDTRDVVATGEDLRLAAQFLARVGLTVETLPGLLVRLVSTRGRSTVMSREAAVLTAIRCLVTRDGSHTVRSVARAA
jgi:hypothetical protein